MKIKQIIGFGIGAILYCTPFKYRLLQMWGKQYSNPKNPLYLSVLSYFDWKYKNEVDPKKRDKMRDMVFGGQSAIDWASFYLNQPIDSFIKELDRIVKKKRGYTIIQIGCCSGLEISWLAYRNKNNKFIGTDIYLDIIKQLNLYSSTNNLSFELCFAEEIQKVLSKHKKVIIFSSGALCYVQPEYIEKFLKRVRNLEFYYNELETNDKNSIYRGGLCWIHNYGRKRFDN